MVPGGPVGFILVDRQLDFIVQPEGLYKCRPSRRSSFLKQGRRFRGKMIHIEVQNPHKVCRGVRSLSLNGEEIPGNLIPADKLRDHNQVKVILE